MSKKKFSKDYLDNLCNEHNIILLRKYSNDELNLKTNINFYCIICLCETSKSFKYMEQNPTCKKCTSLEKAKKAKNTIILKYGVENISQLDEIKIKKKQTTIKNYGVEHNSQSQEIKNKKIITCFKNNGVEHPQQSKEIQCKSKKTCLSNYGVEHPSQSKDIQELSKKTNLLKFGVEYASQNKDFKNKVKLTCLDKYGVEYLQQSKEIQDKSKQTCLNNYGVEHPSQSKEIKQKCKETNTKKYGVNSYSQTDEFKEKCKQTCLNKYGVEHPHQNIEIMEKSSKNAYKSKIFKFKSGNEIKCQGYEPFALTELNNAFDENSIITGVKNVPEIWYYDNVGKKHRYYVDIFIPSQNLCIEVKSTWTIKSKKSNIYLKQKAIKEAGYNYEIWVYDNKGNKVETIL